jgi:glutathione S-transferase
MLKILGRITSSNVQKVVWLCEEMGLPFQREDVGGAFGKNREAPYLALNPNAVVPTIDDDGFILWESNSIVRYLAAKHSMGKIYPTDLKTRASAERWMDWQLTVLGPAHGPVFQGLIRTPPEKRDMNAINAGRDRYSAAVKIMDSYLAKSAYLAGDSFTIGDISPAPFVYRWFTLPIQREDYPNLKRWYGSIAARPGFKKTVIDTGLS